MSGMELTPYKQGYIAKSRRGYYFIYKSDGGDRWYVNFESGTDRYSESGTPVATLFGFRSLEEAKKGVLEYSAKMGDAFD
jgi:hypothetical protein